MNEHTMEEAEDLCMEVVANPLATVEDQRRAVRNAMRFAYLCGESVTLTEVREKLREDCHA